jgi:hypothetical protein
MAISLHPWMTPRTPTAADNAFRCTVELAEDALANLSLVFNERHLTLLYRERVVNAVLRRTVRIFILFSPLALMY